MTPTVVHVETSGHQVAARVGPTAWLVLEHLALFSQDDGDDLVAVETARSVAAAVSVSKDTAARALRRLADAGFVERRQQVRTEGRFGAAGYVLHLPNGLARAGQGSHHATTSPPRPPTPGRRPQPSSTGDQLTLLDDIQEPRP